MERLGFNIQLTMKELTPDERRRYSRTISLPEIGNEGQLRLLSSHVLIVGCGALGSIVAMQLAASGIGHMTVVDFDTVDISNLQRQLAFCENDIGHKKARRLAAKLTSINSGINVNSMDRLLRNGDMDALLADCDVVVEGSDNPATKYMVTDAAASGGIPCVLGAVSGFTGQVQTFLPGHTSYRDWWPDEVDHAGFTPCSMGGLLGPVPSLVASIQAAEVIKILTGIGSTLADSLLTIDTYSMDFHTFRFPST